MGSKHKRKESISARLALLKPEDEGAQRRELGRETRVFDEHRGIQVAMLRLDAEALPNSKIRRSFKRQFETLEGFEHPGVVPVLEAETNDGEGRGYLISPALEGQTLAELLGKAPLDPQEAISLAVDLLNALAAAHHRWLLHGGICPEGVLVSEEEGRRRARFTHFGFSPVIGPARQTSFGEVLVAVDYAAPEMVKGEPIDPTADVYSVGVILFQLLTGRHPVPAVGNDPVRARVQDKADALPSSAVADAELASRLRVILARALEKDPSQRFSSARAFAQALVGEGAPQDAFEDPWAWPEPCPEGGKCAASGAAIPPASERSWSRRQSDRPFRCRASGQDFAGAEQWDTRGLCSKGARHKGLLPVEGEAPEDVIYEAESGSSEAAAAEVTPVEAESVAAEPAEVERVEPKPAEVKRVEPKPAAAAKPVEAKPAAAAEEASDEVSEGSERRATIRELLRNDARAAGLLDPPPAGAGKKPAQVKAAQPADEEEPRLVEDAEGQRTAAARQLSDSTTLRVEEAFLDAWDESRRQTEAATSRMRRVSGPKQAPESGQAEARPSAPSATKRSGEASPAVTQPGRPHQTTPAASSANVFPWQVAAAGLALALALIGFKYGEQDKILAQTREEKTKYLNDLTAAHTERNGLATQVSGLKALTTDQAGKLSASARELEQTRGQLEATRTDLQQRTQERDAAQATGQRLQGELGASQAQTAELRQQLAASQAQTAGLREQLATSQGAAQRLETELARRQEALAQASRDLSARTRDLDEAQRAGAATGKLLAAEQATVLALRRDLAAVRSELSDAEAAALRAARAQDQLRLELKAGQDRLQSAERQLAQEREARAAADARAQAAQEATSAARTALSQAEQALAASAQKLLASAAEAERLRAELAQAEQGGGGPELAALKRERSDLLIELSDLEAEREQLDFEALQLERWLRESEARVRGWERAAREGHRQGLRLRAVDAAGRASDSQVVDLATGDRALAVVELEAARRWLDQALEGDALLSVHLSTSGGGQPALRLLGFLEGARVDTPPSGGEILRLEPLGEGRYRAWLGRAALERLRARPQGAALAFSVTGAGEATRVSQVELVASPLSEDLKAKVSRE